MNHPQPRCCRLPAWAFPAGSALQTLGLALMVGGMLALGAFTAPVVFHQLPRPMAAPVMATIFTRYDIVVLVALGMTIMGEVLRKASCLVPCRSRLSITRKVMLGLLTLSVLYSTTCINPRIEQMNLAGLHRDASEAGQQFDKLHKRSEQLYKLELLLAVLLLLLTPFQIPGGALTAGGPGACSEKETLADSGAKDA